MLGLLAWSQIDFPSAGKVPRLARNAKRARFVSLESSFFVDVGGDRWTVFHRLV